MSRTLAVTAVAVVAVIVWTGTTHAQDAPATPAEADQPAPAASTSDGTEPAADSAGKPASGSVAIPPQAPVKAVNPLSLKWLTRRLEGVSGRGKQLRARVDMLKDAVLRGGGSATATVVHLNKMGGQFRLIRLTYTIDGTQVFNQRDNEGSLYNKTRVEILSGPIAPGNHTIGVTMVYRGHGYGPFKYLNKQEFTVRGSQSFTAVESREVTVDVLGFERKNTPLEQRPAVSFKIAKPKN